MSEHRATFWQVFVMVLIFATIPAAGAIYVIDHNSDVESDNTDTLQCERGNLVRGYLRARSAELPLTTTGARATTLFPILDCEATITMNDPVGIPLSHREAIRYEQVLSTGRLPVVEDGKVVGSEPVP
jgi:hypothetical protein